MGRKKIMIEKQNSAAQRNATYRKRYTSVTKKAMELSIMTDTPVLVIAGKTTGGYNLSIHGERSFDAIVMQYLHEGPEKIERAKTECIEGLQKSYRDGHLVDVRSLLHGSHSTDGEGDSEKKSKGVNIKEQIAQIEAQLASLQKIDRGENIESTELYEMEKSLDTLIKKYRDQKALLSEQNKHSSPFPIYQRDPRCSTSSAAEYVVPTAHLSMSNAMEAGQLDGLIDNTTGSIQGFDPTFYGGTTWPHQCNTEFTFVNESRNSSKGRWLVN